jgi:hypothetical protein
MDSEAVEVVPAVVAAAVASSGPHHPCVAGNSLPLWAQVWQHPAPTERSVRVGSWYRPATRPCPMLDVAELRGRGGSGDQFVEAGFSFDRWFRTGGGGGMGTVYRF